MAKQIDGIYKQYTGRIIKYLASSEFYAYFMDVMEAGKNSFQFSNRKVEKYVDESWVEAIEAVIKPFEEIISNPRNFIVQEEVIVNVALAKRVTPDTIRHLAQHGDMIDTVEEDNVRPNRLMNKFKEDSWNTYENRFVYTLLEMTYEFVDKRYEAIFAAMNEEYGAYLKMHSETASYTELVKTNIDIRIQQNEDLLSADEKNETIFSRIARLHRILGNFRQTGFAKEMSKFGKVKPPLVRTNAIAKNPNFKACHKLWNFIMSYDQVGYNINIYEQSTEIDESFTRDIYHSIMFNYIILKNYLEAPQDREVDVNRKLKKKKLKPRFIKEIVEEMVKNYDLPDVEIRKVLIEEITKAQLMQEEEEERLRLVEEKEKELKEKKRQEELEKARQEKAAEKERLRKEREAERERVRQEREELKALVQMKKEQERKEQEDLRKETLFKEELEFMKENRQAILEKRKKEEVLRQKQLQEEEERQKQEAEKERLRLEKEKELEAARAAKQKEREEEKAKLEAERMKAREKQEQARAREKEQKAREKQRELEKEKARKLKEREKERLAKEKEKQKEKERLAKEKEKEKEKERRAKEKEREKERLAKEKEKAKEKERLAKEKAKAKGKPEQKKAAPAPEPSLPKPEAVLEPEQSLPEPEAIPERITAPVSEPTPEPEPEPNSHEHEPEPEPETAPESTAEELPEEKKGRFREFLTSLFR